MNYRMVVIGFEGEIVEGALRPSSDNASTIVSRV
jgi:hypothetical protein